MPKRVHLVIIDGQNSFCQIVPEAEQQSLHSGELCVPGAWDDMVRVSEAISRLGRKIKQIHLTFDSHHRWHIAHPCWFKDTTGNPPAPFTMMKEVNGVIIGSVFHVGSGNWVEVGEYTPTLFGEDLRWTYQYLRSLQEGNRYPHMIWPYHCLIGTPGHNIVAPLMQAVLDWEQNCRQTVNKITKGSCRFVEHFSAVRPEVPYPKDSSTLLNTDFIQILAHDADEVLIAGEALSHCVASTFRDIAKELGREFVEKCVLLRDATSSVPNFEAVGEAFVTEMKEMGMRETTTKDYLAVA